MNAFTITTRRLRLRSWRMGDAPAYHRHCNTQPVMQHLGGTVPFTHVRAAVRWFMADEARHGHTFWLLERKHDRELLGFAGISVVPERNSILTGRMEIGWRIRADMWLRGYGFEAASAVIEWAEWELDERRVYARIAPENTASQQLARKLGMRRVRALEANSKPDDEGAMIFRKIL